MQDKKEGGQEGTSSCGILDRFSLKGRVALVTGGGQGIGRGFAHALGEAGAKVAVADLVESRAKEVVAELEAKGKSSFNKTQIIHFLSLHTKVLKDSALKSM